MSRLNWSRPRRVFVPWYDRDLFPSAIVATAGRKRAAPSKPKRAKPSRQPLEPAEKPPVLGAGAFSGKALLRTSDLYEARDALCVATEAVIFSDGSCEPNPGRM